MNELKWLDRHDPLNTHWGTNRMRSMVNVHRNGIRRNKGWVKQNDTIVLSQNY